MKATKAGELMRILEFTLFARAEPQGSTRAFVVAGKARITSANKKMRPFRSEVTRMAIVEMGDQPHPLFGKHVPVRVCVSFGFIRPNSAKKRTHPSVKPDIDKLQRAILDALTGVAYEDDAQVVSIAATKRYTAIETVIVRVESALV